MTTTTLPPLAEFVRVVREIAAEQPDRVYERPRGTGIGIAPACLYAHGAEPGCIMGHVAIRLGVPIDVVQDWDGKGGIATILKAHSIQEGVWLDEVQVRQDQGETWGDAVELADRIFPL